MKETLEEAAERILLGEDLDLSDYDKHHILKAMLSIAKWQQEQDKNKYSEEDMVNFYEWTTIMYPIQIRFLTTSDKRGFYTTKELFTKWFEQFKKKEQ